MAAEDLIGNKKSEDPDDKPSKPNSGNEDKDQACTEDIAGVESDQVVKETKDDTNPSRKHETSSGKWKTSRLVPVQHELCIKVVKWEDQSWVNGEICLV